MGKITYKKLKGSQNMRQRLLLATLNSTPILIEDIHADETLPGLRPHEISFLRLLEKLTDDCHIEINETGTKLKYKPGIIVGGSSLVHDCGVSRAIGYFLEPLILLGLFARKPLFIILKGITNDSKDPSVDTFRKATLPMLKRFGVPPEGLKIEIKRRGVPPHGGGEVHLAVPTIQQLTATIWTDEGMVKRIRGIAFTSRVSVQLGNEMIYTARGIFNKLLPDVYIDSDYRFREEAGSSPGYGISLVAETTSGCFISADTTISYPRGEEADTEDEKEELMPAADVGEQMASILLEEIEKGGVVDSSHQGLLFLLCALCPKDVSKVRVGKLSPYGIETLRHIKDFLDVQFVIKPDPSTVCRVTDSVNRFIIFGGCYRGFDVAFLFCNPGRVDSVSSRLSDLESVVICLQIAVKLVPWLSRIGYGVAFYGGSFENGIPSLEELSRREKVRRRRVEGESNVEGSDWSKVRQS
ncbi:RNA 3'-terminal phosphate cyclase [Corchorus olitorius]|uniref:RNA 3'-terminal phosphate cyclase n=1 Tax=Corchorus olitorius TaxID=93759 RepID=A0A1R3I357_9ROSI|nr:RNA 3'-terminal phosphate cyclase [Corchorus olitorius]